MSRVELLEIIGSFGDYHLEHIIIAYVRELFFNGDWGSADALVEYILASGEAESFRGEIASFGVFMAARARNLEKALERYGSLEALAATEANICLRAESLSYLADILLPEDVVHLAQLWLKSLHANLPRFAQEKLALVGASLCEQYSKMEDVQNYDKIRSLMERNLDPIIRARYWPQQDNLPGQEG